MNLYEKTIEQKRVYEGLIVNVRMDRAELPNGHIAKREVIEHPGGVTVAALTDERELLFVRQFRYPYGEEVLELPAGKIERGEIPGDCAIRELKEETGASPGKFIPMGVYYPTPGYCSERIHMFFASELSFEAACPDEDEFLTLERIPLSKAVDMAVSGELKDGKTMCLVFKLAAMIDKKLI